MPSDVAEGRAQLCPLMLASTSPASSSSSIIWRMLQGSLSEALPLMLTSITTDSASLFHAHFIKFGISPGSGHSANRLA